MPVLLQEKETPPSMLASAINVLPQGSYQELSRVIWACATEQVLKTEMCSAREDIIIPQVQGQGFSSDSPLQALLLGQRKQGIRYPKASPIHLPKSTPICGSLHQVIQVFLPNDFRHAYVVPSLWRLELPGSLSFTCRPGEAQCGQLSCLLASPHHCFPLLHPIQL